MTAPVVPTLHATTRLLPGTVDLLAEVRPGDFVFKRNGVGIVARGHADLVAVADVAAALAAIEVDDAVGLRGTGPLAVGALPFDAARGRLRIPRRIVGTDGSSAWETLIEGGEDRRPDPPADGVPDTVLDRPAWTEAVTAILDEINRGTVEKVVLSRRVVVEGHRPFEPPAVIHRLAAERPDAWVYADGDLVGVTPELLAARRGIAVISRPMAGTTPLERRHVLESSPKLLHEFQVVVDAIAERLKRRCTRLSVAPPATVAAGNVAHLSSMIEGELRDTSATALDLALDLHPTPAVGGSPVAPALDLIAALEPAGRGRYAGPVGWVDTAGDGEFAVALRCADLVGDRAVLYAGNGIVAGSDPAEEWEETVAKLVAMRRALG